MITLSSKVTDHLYTYNCIGHGIYLMFQRSANSIFVFSSQDDTLKATIPLTAELNNISFEEFVNSAKGIYIKSINWN